jgi:sigma-B regulation protein RsbU (phosphoserine phosphatase)
MTSTNRFTSLATHLSVWIVSLGVLVFACVLGTNYYLSRYLLEDYIGDLALETISSTVNEIETIFKTVASDAESLAAIVSGTNINEEQIHLTIKAFIASDANIFGMTVALEPHVLHESIGEFSPYYYRKENETAYSDLADASYRYQEWDWYKTPKVLNQPVWSEPYMDTGGGNVLMTTYSVPVRLAGSAKFAGVATADIELDWLEDFVNNIRIGDTGFGYIVSNNDIVIAHPDKSLNMKPLVDILTEEVELSNWQRYLSEDNREKTLYSKTPCKHRSGDCWAVVEAIGATGWKVIIVISDQELKDDINALTLKISMIAVLGILLLALVIVVVARYMTTPLVALARATHDIGAGKLEAKLPEPIRRDEIGLLTSDFSAMRDSLKSYIDKLKKATATKQKLESEIQIAQGIQMSMVPGAGRASIERPQYELYAYLKPARSVGGDLYYFQQDEQLLHFIIGDVSDKGVPAALFMAKTVTLYNSALDNGLSPSAIFTQMNKALCQNNDTCMFVTALCGNLDLDTGKLVMANAGHMNPVLHGAKHQGELIVDDGTVLGLMENQEYSNIEHRIDRGTRLLMYTDGISEAFNSIGEQYDEKRLLNFVSQSNAVSATQLGKATLEDVSQFVKGAEQSDDITLLVLQYGA